MRRRPPSVPRAFGPAATAVALVCSVLLAPAGAAPPDPQTPLSSAVRGLQANRASGIAALSWTQRVTAGAPAALVRNAYLVGGGRVPLPAGTDGDPDTVVTTTLAPTATPVEFAVDPVFSRRSVFPFLWARKSSSAVADAVSPVGAPVNPPSAAVLAPGDTFDVAVSTVRWPYLPAAPAAASGRGSLTTVFTTAARTTVGYTTASGTRHGTVTTIAGLVFARGGSVSGSADRSNPKAFPPIRLPVPADTLGGAQNWIYAAGQNPPGAEIDPVVYVEHGRLVLQPYVYGRLSARRIETIDGDAVDRYVAPFVLVFVSGALDVTPSVHVTAAPGTRLRVVDPAGQVTRSVVGGNAPAEPGPLGGCGGIYGQSVGAAPTATVDKAFRGTHRGLRDWRMPGNDLRAITGAGAIGIDVDGVPRPLLPTSGEADVTSRRAQWYRDIADVPSYVGTDLYDVIDECALSDTARQVTTTQHTWGVRLGLEHRFVMVTDALVVEVRLAVAPDSRATWTGSWPVLRVRVRAFARDGRPHRVRIRTLVTATGSLLVTPNRSTTGVPLAAEAQLPSEDTLVLDTDAGNYIVVAGNEAGGASPSGTDLPGRYAGPLGTAVVTGAKAGPAADDPRPGAATLPRTIDINLMSAPTVEGGAPSYYTGFLTVLVRRPPD
jgi:hypothetical protein